MEATQFLWDAIRAESTPEGPHAESLRTAMIGRLRLLHDAVAGASGAMGLYPDAAEAVRERCFGNTTSRQLDAASLQAHILCLRGVGSGGELHV